MTDDADRPGHPRRNDETHAPAPAPVPAHEEDDGESTLMLPPEKLAAVVKAYRDAGGRGPCVLQVHVSLEDTEAEALAVAREQWRHVAIHDVSLWDIEQPEDFDRLAGEPTDDDLHRGALISADAEELASRIAALVQLGFDRVYVHGISTDQTAYVERAARDLLPALRRML